MDSGNITNNDDIKVDRAKRTIIRVLIPILTGALGIVIGFFVASTVASQQHAAQQPAKTSTKPADHMHADNESAQKTPLSKGWNEYVNVDAGVTFKYPKNDWTLTETIDKKTTYVDLKTNDFSESQSGYPSTQPKGYEISFTITTDADSFPSLQGPFIPKLESDENEIDFTKIKTVEFDGAVGYQYVGRYEGSALVTSILKGATYISATYTIPSGEIQGDLENLELKYEKSENRKIYNEVLNTLTIK